MAIHAEVKTGTDLKLTEVIDLAKGQLDQYGKPFEVIVVSCKPGTFYSKVQRRTSGFEDAFIKVAEGGTIAITYRGGPSDQAGTGTIDFVRNRLGMLEALVAKTEHNIKMLAGAEKQGWWTYKDPDVRNMIMKKYQEMMDARTIEQIEADERMDRPPVYNIAKEEDGVDVGQIESDRKALEAKHKEEMAFLQKQIEVLQSKANEVSKPVVQYEKSKASPAAEYNELKKKAELYGIKVEKTTRLDELRNKIKEAEEILKQAEKTNDNQPVSNVSQE